jgi:RimJ/RimL family protein N-acetyltransferase
LVLLDERHLPEMEKLAIDEGVLAFTRFPSPPEPGFIDAWYARYQKGRIEGNKEAFAVLDDADQFLGVALAVDINREEAEVELGYIVAPAVRGRGIAGELLRKLTDWTFAELGAQRITLYIDVANAGSSGAAANAGYQLEGVLRSAYHKQGLRSDTQVWSRLPSDPAPLP